MDEQFNFHCRAVKLYDIAEVKRCRDGEKFPKGTIYIQVSACRRTGLEQFFMLEEDSELFGKHCAILPKVEVEPEYLLTILNMAADDFMNRYVGTNINIAVPDFKYLELLWHDDPAERRAVVDFCKLIDNECEKIEKQIESMTQFRKALLDDMFV